MSTAHGNSEPRNMMGFGIAVRAGVGVALGVATDELALWIAIGMD